MFDDLIAHLRSLPPIERIKAINELQLRIQEIHPIQHPVTAVLWVPAEQVAANSWNPNKVAPPEMRLLYLSIREDGYTQPIVTYPDPDRNVYEVVDGFHRNRVGKEYKDVRESTLGHLPIVIIKKPIQNRMASTVRHNRARGKHHVEGMTSLVVELVNLGWTDEQIGKHLGMDAEEVLRLKQASGIAELFKDRKYSRSWVLGTGEGVDDT